jgi:RNA polymerase sigma-70 factor (ECF subfamily)
MNADPTRARERAESGLARLFEQHRTELLRFLRARCGDAGEAEDLAQELWIKIAGGSPGPIANGRAYLFRMANNLVLDQRRSRQRAMARDKAWLGVLGRGDRPPEFTPDPSPNAEEILQDNEEADILAEAIAALPAGAARALRLHRLDGLSQAEVAVIMGISRSGVEKHLVVALRHLRRILLQNNRLDCGSFPTATSKDSTDADGGQLAGEQQS